MAYAVETGSRRFVGSGGVIVVHVALAYLLVFGLKAPDILPPLRPPFAGEQIPLPPETPPTPEPQSKDDPTAQKDDQVIVPETTTTFPTDNPTIPTTIDDWPPLPPLPPTPTGGGNIGGTIEPTFLTPKLAKPINDVLRWVTADDYPGGSIRREEEGTTRFSVRIDLRGKATDCSITRSSGFRLLDEAACKNVMKRAKFEAATDKYGAKISGTYSNSVNWRLPE